MATYTFSIGKPDEVRQAGLIQSASFEEALQLVGERISVTAGDTLEIGVKGFPPAHFECVDSFLDGTVFWQPLSLAA